jgi:hypothetical protein
MAWMAVSMEEKGELTAVPRNIDHISAPKRIGGSGIDGNVITFEPTIV